jgi:hypothetical protein
MSRLIVALALLLISLVGTPAALAAEPSILGTWQVDVSRLPVPEPPKSVTIVLAEAGDDRIRMTVDIVSRDGATSHAEATFTPDGSLTPVKGSLDVDIVSMRMPNRRTLVMGAGMAGNPSNTRVFTLSDDGQHMTETIVGYDPGWKPVTRSNSWTRK